MSYRIPDIRSESLEVSILLLGSFERRKKRREDCE